MKFIDFFSGVGGFRRGMELAGHECVGFCEFDKFAVAGYTAMHLMTEQEREYISTLPKNKRVAEAEKEEGKVMGMVILAILIIAYIMIGYCLFLSIIIEDYTQNVWKPILCFLWIVFLWFPYGVYSYLKERRTKDES